MPRRRALARFDRSLALSLLGTTRSCSVPEQPIFTRRNICQAPRSQAPIRPNRRRHHATSQAGRSAGRDRHGSCRGRASLLAHFSVARGRAFPSGDSGSPDAAAINRRHFRNVSKSCRSRGRSVRTSLLRLVNDTTRLFLDLAASRSLVSGEISGSRKQTARPTPDPCRSIEPVPASARSAHNCTCGKPAWSSQQPDALRGLPQRAPEGRSAHAVSFPRGGACCKASPRGRSYCKGARSRTWLGGGTSVQNSPRSFEPGKQRAVLSRAPGGARGAQNFGRRVSKACRLASRCTSGSSVSHPVCLMDLCCSLTASLALIARNSHAKSSARSVGSKRFCRSL